MMSLQKRISRAWRELKGYSPTDFHPGKVILDSTPTGGEEFAAFDDPGIYEPELWVDPEVRRKHLLNQDYYNDIQEKKRFAKHAYRLNWVWVLFLVIVTWLQAVPDWFHFRLDEWAFRIVFGGLTVAVFGFAYLVGKYLFPDGGTRDRIITEK